MMLRSPSGMRPRFGAILLALAAASSIPARAQTQIGSFAAPLNPLRTVVNPVTGKAYTFSNSAGQIVVRVYDPATGSTVDITPTGLTTPADHHGCALAVNPKTNKLYYGLCLNAGATSTVSGHFYEINGATNAITLLISSTVRLNTTAIAVNPETNKVYVTYSDSPGYIRWFDRTALTNGVVTLACIPDSAAVNLKTGKAYFGCGTNYVVMDAANAATTVSLGAGNTAQGIATNSTLSGTATYTYILYTSATGSFVRILDLNDALYATRTVGAAGSGASDILVNPETGRIYVANYSSDQVAYLTSHTDTAPTYLTVGNGPFWLGLNALSGQVFTSDYLGGTVSVIDHADRITTLTTASNPRATGVDPVRGLLYVPCVTGDDVRIFDLSIAANALAPVTLLPVGDGPRAVALAGGFSYNRIFTANYNANTVSVYNAGTYDSPATLNTTLTVGKGPIAMAADSITQTVFVANYSDGSFSSIDTFNLGVSTIKIGGNPIAVAIDPESGEGFIANYTLNNVYRTGDGSTIAVGAGPGALAVDSRRKRLFVANRVSDSVSIIDLRNHKVITTVSAGDYPLAIAVNPETGDAWVANYSSDNVTVIDGTTFTPVTVAAGDGPYDVVVNPDRNRGYVVNYLAGTVSIIDGATRTPLYTRTVTSTANDLEFDPAAGDVWVGTVGTAPLYRIEGPADTLVNMGVSYNSPRALAVNPQTRRVFVAVYGTDQLAEVLERRPLSNNLTVSFNSNSVSLNTSDPTPPITITAQPFFAGTPPVQAVYYSIDSLDGPWTAASYVSGNDWSATPTFTGGPHVLYAFAADGHFATSNNIPGGPVPGRIGSLRVMIGRPSVVTDVLPIGKVAEKYYAAVTLDAYSFDAITGCSATGLPAGITSTLASPYRCDLNGTPTVAGSYPVTLTVTDENGQTDSRAYTLLVTPGDPLSVGTGRLPDYNRATAPYAATLVARGGIPPYSWSCTFPPAFAGALTCNPSTGVVGGTLGLGVADGTYSVTATVTDSLAAVASKALPLQVYNTPQILNTSLAAGYTGRDYGVQQLFGVGGSGTATWSVSAGALPAGLTLDGATGRITGTPTVAGTSNLTVDYTTIGGSASKSFSILVSDPVPPPHWVRRGLAGGNLALNFSPAFTSDRTLYGATGALVYKSTDGGYYWSPSNLKLLRPVVNNESFDNVITGLNAVGFSPDFNGTAPASGTNHHLFVGTESTGVWFSPDNDATWFKMTTGLGSNQGTGLYNAYEVTTAADYPTSKRIFVSSWASDLGRYALYTAIVNTATPTTTVFTRRSPDGLMADRFFYSPPAGGTRTIFAVRSVSGAAWLYRSLDSGVTWSLINGALPVYPYFVSFSPNFATDQTFAIAPYAGLVGAGPVSITRDGGITFEQRGGTETHAFVAFPPDYNASGNPVIYASKKGAGYTYTLTISTDNGLTFRPTGTAGLPPAEFFYGLFWISPDHAVDNTVFAAGLNQAGIYRSGDRGGNWFPSDGGLYIRDLSAIAAAPTGGRYFAASRGLLFYSNNGGKAWKQSVLPEVYTEIRAIFPAPNYASNQRVFALADTGSVTKLLRSTDGGQTFTARFTLPSHLSSSDSRLVQISPNFASDGRIFLLNPNSYGGYQFFRSTDDNSATPFNFEQQGAQYQLGTTFGVSPGFATDQTLYFTDWGYNIPTDSWGYKPLISTDGNNAAGMTVVDFPTGPFDGGRNSIVFPKEYKRTGVTTPERTFFFNCYKSTDAGATFAQIPPSGAGCSDYGSLWVSPNYVNDQTLYSAVEDTDVNNALLGLYKSTTGGSSFTRLTAPASPTAFDSINQIQISPNYAVDSTVLVATEFGLYITRDAGLTWTLTSGTESVASDITATASDPLVPGRTFVGTNSGEIYMTSDDGFTSVELTANLPAIRINSLAAVGTSTTYLFATTDSGFYRLTNLSGAGTWSAYLPGTAFGLMTYTPVGAANRLYIPRKAGGGSYYTDNFGSSYTLMSSGNPASNSIDYNAQTTPTLGGPAYAKGAAGGELPAVTNASLWSANPASGAYYSPTGTGSSWVAAPGGNDYVLPGTSGYTTVKALGVNAASGGRELLLGHSTLGLYRSLDGGDTWRAASGPGSGLELTSQNVSTFLTTTTVYGATDVLVGVNGATTGGVYLSSDGGEHWTQVNQGFDPNNLSISSLVKTSCAGCPVQYYSGTYGSGVYTRTITVNNPPAFPVANYACFGSTGCACATTGGSGPEQGGQAFRLCGTGFANGIVVEFDGVPATGCTQSGGAVITCTGTPPHAPGSATIRVRNTDTRVGYLPASYTYNAGAPRTGNTLRAAKASADAWISWTCASCTAGSPARLYRGQNALLSLYPETYNGGANGTLTGGCTAAAGNNSCHNQTGATGSAQSYFWTVE